MRYAKELMLSTTVALFATGCVKPTEQVTTSGTTTTTGTTVYTTGETATTGTYTPVYEDSSTIVYEDPATTGSGTLYGGATTTEGTVITTDGYSSTPVSGGGAYGNPYGTTATTTAPVYTDPYAVGTTDTAPYTYDDPYGTTTTTTAVDYTTNTSYDTGSSYLGGGIQLQVAALRDYASALEFKNSLSLDPKYSAYVKRGAMNKVIITGIATRAEAKRLAATRFPDAFIVGGSEISGASSYTPSGYTGGSSVTGNGIGVQVGAFSSKASARAAAERAAAGRYTAIVKTAKVRGRTIYKAIILGFSSKQEARAAIASGQFGDAFVVSNIH